MAKWYGSLQNRLEENKQFGNEIYVGMGATEYWWSDRDPWEVIAVKDQKHVTIRAMDHKHVGDGHMDNNWELISNPNNPTRDLVKRGKYWYTALTVTKADYEALDDSEKSAMIRLGYAQAGIDKDVVMAKGKQTKYNRMNISFGKASYYYDYEF